MNVTSLFHSKPVPILIQALMYKGRKISHKRPWPQWNPEIYKINYRYNSLLQCIEKHTLCWYTCNIGRKLMIMKVIINQLLFACKKYLLGLWEPFQSDYFSLRTSSQIDKQSPRTSSVPINFKIKLSWIKVGFQSTIYMYTAITNIYFILNVIWCKLTLKALQKKLV